LWLRRGGPDGKVASLLRHYAGGEREQVSLCDLARVPSESRVSGADDLPCKLFYRDEGGGSRAWIKESFRRGDDALGGGGNCEREKRKGVVQ